MILSIRVPRTFRKASKTEAPRNHDLPGRDEAFRDADSRPARDPDWAIREIVDDAMFETAR